MSYNTMSYNTIVQYKEIKMTEQILNKMECWLNGHSRLSRLADSVLGEMLTQIIAAAGYCWTDQGWFGGGYCRYRECCEHSGCGPWGPYIPYTQC